MSATISCSQSKVLSIYALGNKHISVKENGSVMPRIHIGYTVVLVNLSRNTLEIINTDDFCFVPFVAVIDLSHNVISSLRTRAFHNLTNLQIIFLNGN